MAKSKYAAYAGDADMPNGSRVEVRYLDLSSIRTHFGLRPPGHPQRKRVGWYWRPAGAADWAGGPFTSSRQAMQDAIDRNRNAGEP